ncbi:MAG: hypothetical protein AAGD28_02905 [Bacteroidota bacterium]
MKTPVLILLLTTFLFSTAKSQNYRYLDISLRSKGTGAKFSANQDLLGQRQVTGLQIKPGFSIGAGIGRKVPNSKLALQFGAALSYYALDYNLTLYTAAFNTETISVSLYERSENRVLIEISPSVIYALPNVPIDLRLGIRSGFLLSSFGQAAFTWNIHTLPAPNILGDKTDDRFSSSGSFNNCCDEFFGWAEVGVKYWFSKNQELGLELFGGISPSVLNRDIQEYDYIFGIHLIKRWDRASRE